MARSLPTKSLPFCKKGVYKKYKAKYGLSPERLEYNLKLAG
jgi:hypothetical protein